MNRAFQEQLDELEVELLDTGVLSIDVAQTCESSPLLYLLASRRVWDQSPRYHEQLM